MGYLIIVDIWEADVHVDVPTLIAGGVDGMIVRLNDMNGGHHKDELFDLNWERAKLFPLQAAYFVYNPWVDALTNKTWLYDNLPSDYGSRRVLSDIEVRKKDLSPIDYGKEVRAYDHSLVNPKTNYTGGGYVGLLDKWPGGSYWWARYPYIVAPPNGLVLTWEKLQELLDKLYWSDADLSKLCPGKIDLWQVTDRVVLPGMSGRAIDISIYPGTLDEAKKFFNVPFQNQPEVKMYETYAKGLFLYEGCSIVDASLLKDHVDFIIGEVGVGQTPKPKFKEWAELAKLLNVPFIGFVGSDPEPYIPMSYNSSMWGTPDTDITCKMMDVQRHYPSGTVVPVHSWIVDGSKFATVAGKNIPDTWMGSIFEHTIAMVEQRFKLHVFPFIKKETLSQKVNPIPANGKLITMLANMNKMSTYFPSVNRISTGWGNVFIPSDSEGPQQPYAPNWDFWWYGSANVSGINGGVPLFLYRGTPEELNKKVNFVPSGDPNPDPEPNPEPIPAGAIGLKLNEAEEMLKALPSNRYVSIAITELEKLQAFVEVFVE